MGLQEIKARILDEATAKAGARLETARQEAEKIRSEGKRAAGETERRLLRRARHEAEARKERLVTNARLAARKAILAEKQAALDGVFRTASESFAASKAALRAALKGALLDAIETGEEALSLAPAGRGGWGDSLVEELNAELSSRGRKGAIRLADSGFEIASGAVLHRPGVEVNLSLEVIARQVRERVEDKAARLLFDAALEESS
ncbi:MAG: V-type ATP synthase subunit E [Nitrospinota bacterium]